MLNFLAQVTPAVPEIDPGAAGTGLMDAIAQSHWTLVIGFAVMLVVWILQKFVMPNVNTKALPWIAILVATLGVGSVALIADPVGWLTAIFAGVQAGLSAAGTYGLLPGGIKKAMKPKPV